MNFYEGAKEAEAKQTGSEVAFVFAPASQNFGFPPEEKKKGREKLVREEVIFFSLSIMIFMGPLRDLLQVIKCHISLFSSGFFPPLCISFLGESV